MNCIFVSPSVPLCQVLRFFLIPLQTFSRDDVFVDGKVTKSLLYLSWRTSLLVKNAKHITCGITISHSRSKCFSLRFGYPKTVFLNLSCPFTVFKKTERSQVENPTRPATWPSKLAKKLLWFGESSGNWPVVILCWNPALKIYLEPCFKQEYSRLLLRIDYIVKYFH